MGVATLDGLGVMGGGARTHEKHILVSSLVPGAILLARLIAALQWRLAFCRAARQARPGSTRRRLLRRRSS